MKLIKFTKFTKFFRIEEQPDDYWEYSRQTDSLFDDDVRLKIK